MTVFANLFLMRFVAGHSGEWGREATAIHAGMTSARFQAAFGLAAAL